MADKNYKDFQKYLSSKFPSKNWFYAIRADGHFKYIKTRSVPRQNKPYPPLAEVVKQQSIFEEQDIDGTLVGFWCPAFVKGVNVPGYHLHFLSSSGFFGGHVLDFEMSHGLVEVDISRNLNLILPTDTEFQKSDLTADLGKELHAVEKDKK